MARVYVGGLKPELAEQDLEAEFSRYGAIRTIWVARKPPGFAFIEFEDTRDAEDAVRKGDGVKGWRVQLSKRPPSNSRGDRDRGGDRGRDRDRYSDRRNYDSRDYGRGSSGYRSEVKCYECNERGHIARDCRNRGGRGRSPKRDYSPRRRDRSPRRRDDSPRRRDDSPRRRDDSPRRRDASSRDRRRDDTPPRKDEGHPTEDSPNHQHHSPEQHQASPAAEQNGHDQAIPDHMHEDQSPAHRDSRSPPLAAADGDEAAADEDEAAAADEDEAAAADEDEQQQGSEQDGYDSRPVSASPHSKRSPVDRERSRSR